MDRRNPHNSYYYKPLDQAAPVYVPPSHSTQRIMPVPQKAGQSDYSYGMPGQASPVYVPPSKGADKRSQEAMRQEPKNVSSDRHSKEKIEKLSSTNEALMRALDDAHQGAPEGNMPPTEYPKLPSHTNFAPADRVAAQNVGIQAASPPPAPVAAPPPPPRAPAPPPQGMQANPQQANFARSQNPAFAVNQGMPDMSALDEAYRRQSQGG